MTIDITPEAVELLAHCCDGLGYRECATTLRALSAALTDYQRGQSYRYIGKDGLPILARDLEDQRDAAIAALTASQAETAAAYEDALDAASGYTQRVYGDEWTFLSNPTDRDRILAAIPKGKEHEYDAS